MPIDVKLDRGKMHTVLEWGKTALMWLLKAVVWLMTVESRMMQSQVDALRKQPGFEEAAKEAHRLDTIQGGHRNMHRVMDRYGVPDARWFK